MILAARVSDELARYSLDMVIRQIDLAQHRQPIEVALQLGNIVIGQLQHLQVGQQSLQKKRTLVISYDLFLLLPISYRFQLLQLDDLIVRQVDHFQAMHSIEVTRQNMLDAIIGHTEYAQIT